MRVWAACLVLLAAGVARAQTVSAVYLSAPQVRVISGESVKITAVPRDAAGNAITTAAVTWTSNNAGVARVDSSGNVQTGALGYADITATAGGRQGVIRLQVLPDHIEVTPSDVSVNFGGRQHFDAVAYDSQGKAIEGTTLTWRVMVGGGSTDSTTVPISNGDVNARTLGYYVVRASFVYPNVAAQFEREAAGSATMRIVPGDYRVKPLVSSWDSYPSLRVRGKRGTIAVNDSGNLAFSSTLDGITGALLKWRGAGFNVLATAGTPGVTPSTVYYDFDNVSVDSRGTVLAQASMIGSNTTLVLADESIGLMQLLPDRVVADAVLDVTGMTTNRFSLSETGEVAFRGNFHYPDSTVNYNGILRYFLGDVYLEASTKDPLPGLEGAVTFDDQYGMDGNGALYFSASAGSSRAVYRKEFGRAAVKVIATGDSLSGQVVTQISHLVVSSGGDVVIRAVLADGSQVLARYQGGFTGKGPVVMNSSPGYVSNLYFANSQGGVVWLGDAGPGFGLYLWPAGDAPAKLLLPRFGPLPSGEPVADFYSAAVDAGGNVYATVRGVQTNWALVRLNNSPAVLVSNGMPVSTPANLDVSTILTPGDRTGPAHFLAGGNQQSIFQADDRGPLPAMLVGDTLPGGATYTGNNFPRKSPSGDLYVTTDSGLFRLTSSSATLVTAFPASMSDGVNVNAPFNLSVNDSTQYIAIANTNSSHQRLTLFDGRALRTIGFFNGSGTFRTASPAGGTFQGVSEMALNESGQVMINATVTGGQGGMFFYDGSAWRSVCVLQNCRFDNETVTTISNLRASNNRFCAVFNTAAGNNRLDCWEGGAWTNILKRGDFTSDGTEVNNVNSAYDMNRNGDAAVVVNTGLGGPSIFLRTANGFSTVHSVMFPAADGPSLIGIYAIDLRDDRRVFFTAMDNTSRMVIYEADPKF
jgi:hypothetical protein